LTTLKAGTAEVGFLEHDRRRGRVGRSTGPDPAPQAAAERDGVRGYVRSRSRAMMAVETRALRVAPSDETILILGETGVGKDVMARLIHRHSARRDQAFVHLNCAALPESLLEAELFGHVKGSYTGAVDSRPGQFEMASGGTLFLDEIGELAPRLQAKLLHVLQEGKIYRVGGRQSLDVDVRVIAATNRDLGQAIRTGGFRRDLLYRLNVVTLRIPPLRERAEDLEDLAHHFFRTYAGLYRRPDFAAPSEESLLRLKDLKWDGNIRELENAVKRIILLDGAEDLETEWQRCGSRSPDVDPETPASPAEEAEPQSLKETARRAAQDAERRVILRTLARTSWNRKRAARELGVSYRALLYKIKDYTIHPDAVPPEGQGESLWH
jgi:transcriptional regulator with GAF, ATPase, and Fis domain